MILSKIKHFILHYITLHMCFRYQTLFTYSIHRWHYILKYLKQLSDDSEYECVYGSNIFVIFSADISIFKKESKAIQIVPKVNILS